MEKQLFVRRYPPRKSHGNFQIIEHYLEKKQDKFMFLTSKFTVIPFIGVLTTLSPGTVPVVSESDLDLKFRDTFITNRAFQRDSHLLTLSCFFIMFYHVYSLCG